MFGGGDFKGERELGRLCTVWDGEVAGIRKALGESPPEWKVLIMTDSEAAIAAVRKAGRRGRSRAADLGSAVLEFRERQERLRPGAVKIMSEQMLWLRKEQRT